jgi:hypothetical protein
MPGILVRSLRRFGRSFEALRAQRPGFGAVWAAAAPVLLAAGWLLALFWPLASAGRALANRDVPLFHLPLRASFRSLLPGLPGLPAWNPWLHGGQPILSNPNYAAFYPPTWLALALPPAAGLALLAVLHAALAGAGAWRLARRLGCGRGAAALALVATAGALVPLLSSFNLYCGLAWLPWVLVWGDAALRAPAGAPWHRSALLAGAALASTLLAGEPVAALIAGLGLFALAVDASWGRPPSLAGARPTAAVWARSLLIAAGALALAAAQLVPTAVRLADSPRAGGLAAERAMLWSAPPGRFVELVFPRFFGDPAAEDLFFGWRLHDLGYPYLPSLYPGLLITLLAATALLRGGIPRQVAWTAAAAAGLLLALGRHDPLYEALRRLPPLSLVRYPEKFAGLLVVALVFAAACGWQRLLAERRAGRPGSADLPLALALVALATALGLAGLLAARPEVADWFVRTQGSPLAGPATVARGAAALRFEAWAAATTAAAVAGLFALCRVRRVPERALAAAAVVLLAADLWRSHHGLVQTVPAAWYREPPPLAAALSSHSAHSADSSTGDRIFLERPADDQPEVFPHAGGALQGRVQAQLARLEPYSGLLWGLGYALHEDYDLLLTGPARRALDLFHAEEPRPDLSRRLLGAWNIGTVLERRPPAQWLAETARGLPPRPPQPVTAVPNPYRLPRLRFVPRVSFHTGRSSAIGGARAAYYALHLHEHCVREEGPGATVDYPAPPEPLALEERGGRTILHYRAPGPAFLTIADTWDSGWRATVDGRPLRIFPTAIEQIGIELPAGEHRLELVYRDSAVGLGAAVSGVALGLGLLLWRRSARQ